MGWSTSELLPYLFISFKNFWLSDLRFSQYLKFERIRGKCGKMSSKKCEATYKKELDMCPKEAFTPQYQNEAFSMKREKKCVFTLVNTSFSWLI